MGYYINPPETGNKRKADALIMHHGAAEIFNKPVYDSTKGLVCVVDNGMFEAAAFVYNESEFKAFNDPSDDRPKRWVQMDRTKAKEMSRCPY